MICNTYKQFFGTLADSTKSDIISLLRKNPLSVSDICRKLNLEQSRVSHNLRKLKSLGFVLDNPNGKERIYKMHPGIIHLFNAIDRHVDTYYKHYCKCAGNAKIERWKGR